MTARRTCLLALVVATGATAACSSTPAARPSDSARSSAPIPTPPVGSSAATSRSSAPASRTSQAPAERVTSLPMPASSSARSSGSSSHPTATAGRLPLGSSTGSARQVITVVAPSTGSTSATLQAWHKVSDGWARTGPALHAWLGSEGMTRSPSESRAATPIGSFTLTRAFGHDANPGTSLPYTRTTPSDWWISHAGPTYNTLQHCTSANCHTGADEHLYYETPAYDHAVIIDYNTANAPGGVRQGAGSAFFLHVSQGEPTAGCVSIDAGQLVRIMRWLDPAAHPRMLIGTG